MYELEQVIPVWAMVAMVNSDESGLTESESLDILEYSVELIVAGYNAIPAGQTEDVGFCTTNDLNNFGGDCFKVTFLPLID